MKPQPLRTRASKAAACLRRAACPAAFSHMAAATASAQMGDTGCPTDDQRASALVVGEPRPGIGGRRPQKRKAPLLAPKRQAGHSGQPLPAEQGMADVLIVHHRCPAGQSPKRSSGAMEFSTLSPHLAKNFAVACAAPDCRLALGPWLPKPLLPRSQAVVGPGVGCGERSEPHRARLPSRSIQSRQHAKPGSADHLPERSLGPMAA